MTIALALTELSVPPELGTYPSQACDGRCDRTRSKRDEKFAAIVHLPLPDNLRNHYAKSRRGQQIEEVSAVGGCRVSIIRQNERNNELPLLAGSGG
jgi:hypothetical protein